MLLFILFVVCTLHTLVFSADIDNMCTLSNVSNVSNVFNVSK